MTRWDAVSAWLAALRAHVADAPTGLLSPAGRDRVLALALDAWTDDVLATLAARPTRPWPTVGFLAARTVLTAPLEWCALALGAGSEVVLKPPREGPGLADWLAHHAASVGLPLHSAPDPASALSTELVVVMGSDDTVDRIRTLAPGPVLGFGHRVSVAWWPAGSDGPTTARALAADLAAHDSRGCMTPSVVYTDAEPDTLVPSLAAALDEAQARWPRGTLHPGEHARLRSRTQRARATGRAVVGDGWAIHVQPLALTRPEALPRSVQLVRVDDAAQALDHARRLPLSTVGLAPGADPAPWRSTGAPRVTTLGTMQAPPVLRLHDGVDHLAVLLSHDAPPTG